MKGINNLLPIFVTMFIISSCMSNSSFNSEELKYVNPYLKSDTAVFKSFRGLIDTIIFSSINVDTVKYRNFAQGYYNENILRVSYKLTNNSFHKLLNNSANGEPVDFISFSKAKDSHYSKEIYFLGLLFDENYLDQLKSTGHYIIFKSDKAKYTGLNINKGIKSFKFSFAKGVESFDDDEEWIRVN